MPDDGIEDLYATVLENLCGFDLEELERMSKDDLLAHFEAASHAFQQLDENLTAGAAAPLDWQPAPDELVGGRRAEARIVNRSA